MGKSKRLAGDKRPSGVAGVDEITGGGLARGRITLVVGGPGCGKTIFALGALVAGVRQGEPGIFISFEESNEHIRHDMQSFDWGLARISEQKLAFIDGELPSAVVQGGDFDLLGLLAVAGANVDELAEPRRNERAGGAA